MAKIATLTEVQDIKLGDVIATPTIDGPLHRKVVRIRHNPGSTRYVFNLEDNDYFTMDAPDATYVITEE
jgi:hypothetical protein